MASRSSLLWRSADGAIVMGDLVLTESEVNPVMSKLLEGGIEVTAVHNHLMRASPATFYVHVHGHGDPVTIAMAIRAALAESKTPFGAPSSPSAQTPQIDLDKAKPCRQWLRCSGPSS